MKKQNFILGTIAIFTIIAAVFYVLHDQNSKKEARFNHLILSHMNILETMMSEESMHKVNVDNIYHLHLKNMEEPMKDFEHSCKRYYIGAISLNKHMDAFKLYHDTEQEEYFAMCKDISAEIDPYRDSLEIEVQRAVADYDLYMLNPYSSFEKEQIIIKYESVIRKADNIVNSLSFDNYKKTYIDIFFDNTSTIDIERKARIYAYW